MWLIKDYRCRQRETKYIVRGGKTGEVDKHWWGQLRGVKGEKTWWQKKYEYKPGWWKNIPGYEPGKPVIPGRLLSISFLDELEIIRGRNWGAQGEIGKLKSV